MTSNLKTAQLLKRVAAVFRVIEGDTFRYKAYINAAVAIENLTEPVESLWKNDELDTIPGVGPNLQRHLGEYFQKGKVRHFESLFKKVPAGMFPLMEIRGVGPMTAYKISKKFKLTNPATAINDLKKVLKENRLTEIEGFKEKTVARLNKAIKVKTSGKRRLLLSTALGVAESFLKYIKESPIVIDAQPLGSLRRRLTTVGDIDLSINTKDPAKAMLHALAYPQIRAVITKGDKVSHVKLQNELEVDIKTSEPSDWGSLLQHYTGSKLHNIKLRTIAKDHGLSLSEYGIAEKGKLIHFKTEKDFYSYLDLQYIPPEIREGEDEIELARKNKLPKLLDLDHIKGDLHIHSDFNFPSSHDLGNSGLSSILNYAYKNNYEYLGISDHNPKFTGLSELQKEKLMDKRKKYLQDEFCAYEKAVKNRGIKLLIGMEIDIRPDGSLALSDKQMEKLDYSIVSIHSSFDQTTESNTRRIIKALSHSKATILGHPTGQLLGERDQIAANWEKILKFCSVNHKIVEINASPHRADLPYDLIKKAVSFGVKLIINTDSHDESELNVMKYGVWQARRGYATKKDIVNAGSYQNLQTVLKLSQH